MTIQAITQDEAERIISLAQKPPEKLFIMLLWYTGGRCSEVLTLRPEQVGDGYLVMDNLKQHKEKMAIKQVFVPTAITEYVKGYISEYQINIGTYIFARMLGGSVRVPLEHWSRQHAWNVAKRLASKAGVMKVNRFGKIVPAWSHCWRHAYGTLAYSKTHDLLFVKQQLGHSNIRNTEVYVHLSEEEKKQKVEGMYS